MNSILNTNNADQNKNHIEESITLIDWTSSIWGIFYGVWIGCFMDKLSNMKLQGIIFFDQNIKTFEIIYYFIFGLLIIIFTINMVKFLWSIRKLYLGSSIPFLLKSFIRSLTIIFSNVLFIFLTSYLFEIKNSLVAMGIISIVGWILTVYIICFSGIRAIDG